ncbi:hypothetical protein [Acetobacter sp.]|uniref:hypothetical protein n=1 Tax=Acetobacter sp. TaxID=440 RepID=UPI0025C0755A|nr:hypothetical protein [Acetobacter sp.]MCH4091487.1 hypothetical protein [Acetobacter sp.]MCI1299465.1 hypothetical protein [Acetobacter sp.]MCI1316945.1 hypothetical protein [Acetobacter sp.]
MTDEGRRQSGECLAVPPPVDPAEEQAFLERRLLELLEKRQADDQHIQALENRVVALEKQLAEARFGRIGPVMLLVARKLLGRLRQRGRL